MSLPVSLTNDVEERIVSAMPEPEMITSEADPVPLERRSLRHQRVHALLEPQSGRGLEIGPLFSPIVFKGDGEVSYLDVYPGEQLRETYRDHVGVPIDQIVDPDFFLIGPDGTKTLAEAVAPAAPFQWAVASHVVEHVPDFIGWLEELAEVLDDDARLVMVVPDRRFCFDAIRSPTTVGEMLLAHQNRDLAPSVRAVYDHYSHVVTLDLARAWEGQSPERSPRIHDLDFVLAQLERQPKEYVDCHVWLFTPGDFVAQFAELDSLGLVSFIIDRVIPAVPGDLEFYVRLRRISRGLSEAGRGQVRRSGIRQWEDRELDDAPSEAHPSATLAVLSDREMSFLRAKRKVLGRVRAVLRRPVA